MRSYEGFSVSGGHRKQKGCQTIFIFCLAVSARVSSSRPTGQLFWLTSYLAFSKIFGPAKDSVWVLQKGILDIAPAKGVGQDATQAKSHEGAEAQSEKASWPERCGEE